MKIAVLVSGGVDSSVVLQLLKNQGHDVTAFYLKVWLEDELSFLGSCPWEEDLRYINELCTKLQVPLEILSVQRAYHDRVVAYTLAEIREGRTPSPDIFCNQMIKCGIFYDLIDTSYEKVATGHYAQLEEAINNHEKWSYLKRAADSFKDQTYFLSRLSQEQRSRLMFPIGHLKKSEVRALAQEYNIPSKDRRDSQGICFLGSINFSDFIRYHQGVKLGDLIEYETGKKMGTHDGFWFYTIGQRRGIGLGGGPWYVVSKDTKNNIVFISRHYHAGHLIRNRVHLTDMHWLTPEKPDLTAVEVKLRHGEYCYQATVKETADGLFELSLNGQDQGIAPGQFAVLYHKEYVLGSGRICLPGEMNEDRVTI